MTVFPRVAVLPGEYDGDWVRSLITARGYGLISADTAPRRHDQAPDDQAPDDQAPDDQAPDVVVAPPAAPLPSAWRRAILGGSCGLVVWAAVNRNPDAADDERDDVSDLLRTAGITRAPSSDAGAADPAHGDGAPAIDLLARVDPADLRVSAAWRLAESATAVLRSAGRSASPAAALSRAGAGTVVALGVHASGPSMDEFLMNAITAAAPPTHHHRAATASGAAAEPAWLRLKDAVGRLQPVQDHDGAVPDSAHHPVAATAVDDIIAAVIELTPRFAHDADYLSALVKDFVRWGENGFSVPDFLDSLAEFHPERERVDGREHLVVFPMYTQNGSPDRHVEAVLVQVIWPSFVAALEAGGYSNKLFVPIRFLDFTAGYDTNSAVLFPETVAMREVPKFTWGAIFADREAARFRSVVSAAAEITGLPLPPDAARLLDDQALAEETFVMWDLIHDRTHMHGDLPFDPFMIKQRMPYFLYSLEELRCDLTAFAESVKLERQGVAHARLVQYAVVFDRIFRFAITGSRVRNYDGLGGQLLFAWLHQHHVLHWTDNRLTIDWSGVTTAVLELGRQIEQLYWRSIDRPKVAHWLAAYELVSNTVEPHPASTWAKGVSALPVEGPPKGLTDAVLPDEFPLSMFYEALGRKLSPVVAATSGITG